MNIEVLIKKEVKKLVECLVDREYHKLEKMNKIGVLKSDELEEAILQYGENLTYPPDEAFENMDIFKVSNSQKCYQEYSIDIELWTNGCKSDLTLSCEVIVDENNQIDATIYSIHVL